MSTLRQILGDQLVKQTNMPVWGVNQEGEMSSAGFTQPQRHLWVALGGMAQIRCWSKYLVSPQSDQAEKRTDRKTDFAHGRLETQAYLDCSKSIVWVEIVTVRGCVYHASRLVFN